MLHRCGGDVAHDGAGAVVAFCCQPPDCRASLFFESRAVVSATLTIEGSRQEPAEEKGRNLLPEN
jgi:hypothetical protein